MEKFVYKQVAEIKIRQEIEKKQTKETVPIVKTNVPENAKRISYKEVDDSYDLTEAVGFHGASCHRWAPHFELYEPVEETDPTNTENVDWSKYQTYAFE